MLKPRHVEMRLGPVVVVGIVRVRDVPMVCVVDVWVIGPLVFVQEHVPMLREVAVVKVRVRRLVSMGIPMVRPIEVWVGTDVAMRVSSACVL